MGDPRKNRKKYTTPSHPWQKERIEEEKLFLRDYGLKNKTEVWKMDSFLRSLFQQAKKVIREQTKQSEKEKQQLLDKVVRLGLMQAGSRVEDVLSLTIKDIFGRRLQTVVARRGLARSTKQARQFITHKHIFIGDKAMTAPSYLVTVAEESMITFRANSPLANPDHPERAPVKREAAEHATGKKEAAPAGEAAPAEEKKEEGSKKEEIKQDTEKEKKPAAKKPQKKSKPVKEEGADGK